MCDRKCIASNFRRGSKPVYETALWCSLGDPPIIYREHVVFATPLARGDEGHILGKPEEMLRHILSMGVNNLTILFDPTCGSRTCVTAALSFGAARALGLELNPTTATSAQLRLEQALQRGKDA